MILTYLPALFDITFSTLYTQWFVDTAITKLQSEMCVASRRSCIKEVVEEDGASVIYDVTYLAYSGAREIHIQWEEDMNKLSWISVLALVFFCFSYSVFAADMDLGEGLVRQLWKNMKESNVSKIESYIAPGFQSVHQDGIRDRIGELQLIKNLNLGKYTLDNFTTTQNDSVIIVTYSVSVEETIADKRLPKRTSMRMSIFMKIDNGWKWLAHANLNPLKDNNSNVMDYSNKSKAKLIDELVTLQTRLEESEERYRTLTRALNEASQDGIVINSLNGMTVNANQTYLDMLGYTLEEVQQITYQQLTPQKWYEMEQKLFNLVMKRGYSGPYEKEYIRKNGTVFPIRIQAWFIRDKQGNPYRLLGIVRDISEERGK